jgi:hypothetical protein
MEIAKALWQLFCAILIFATCVLCMVFVAPSGFGLAAFFIMDQLSQGKLLARCHCCFYRNTDGTARRRDLARCSIVDFRKPRSVPLNPRLLGCRTAYLSRGIVRLTKRVQSGTGKRILERLGRADRQLIRRMIPARIIAR